MITFQLARQTETGVELSQHTVMSGCTVLEALLLEGISLHISKHRYYAVGVWSCHLKPEKTLNDGDRIELYLPLQADPKDARRERVLRSVAQQAAKENAANRAARALRKLKFQELQVVETLNVLSPRPAD
jgi:uncharacterized protein